MNHPSSAPFEEGDRVDHKLFGFGTVSGALVAMVGPDTNSLGGLRDAGWSVPVRWDDPSRTATQVASHVLRKVSSPDSRPFAVWDRQWQPLLQAWIAARRDTERALSNFRPVPDLTSVAAMKLKEVQAFEAMEHFWEDEKSGRHP
jgi:hypothetical protein